MIKLKKLLLFLFFFCFCALVDQNRLMASDEKDKDSFLDEFEEKKPQWFNQVIIDKDYYIFYGLGRDHQSFDLSQQDALNHVYAQALGMVFKSSLKKTSLDEIYKNDQELIQEYGFLFKTILAEDKQILKSLKIQKIQNKDYDSCLFYHYTSYNQVKIPKQEVQALLNKYKALPNEYNFLVLIQANLLDKNGASTYCPELALYITSIYQELGFLMQSGDDHFSNDFDLRVLDKNKITPWLKKINRDAFKKIIFLTVELAPVEIKNFPGMNKKPYLFQKGQMKLSQIDMETGVLLEGRTFYSRGIYTNMTVNDKEFGVLDKLIHQLLNELKGEATWVLGL
jgi:hypothetical protein